MKDKNQKVEKEKVAPKAKEKIIDDGVSKEEMSPEQYVEYLETTIGKTFAEAQDCKNQAQRIQAEFENYRKRNESFGQEMRQLGIAAVVEKMIEVLDNCDRAREYIKDENSLMGFNIMEQQIIIGLKTFGLSECVISVGDELDVQNMHVIERENKPELDGKVTEICSKGYALNGKIIRPAKVKVGYAPSEEQK